MINTHDILDDYDILELYHENSKNVRWMMRNRKAHQIHYERHVLELMAIGPKVFQNRAKLLLPGIDQKNKCRVRFETVMRRRRSSRNFGDSPMKLADLAKVLYFANGITETYISDGY